jgi:hypothetical protein
MTCAGAAFAARQPPAQPYDHVRPAACPRYSRPNHVRSRPAGRPKLHVFPPRTAPNPSHQLPCHPIRLFHPTAVSAVSAGHTCISRGHGRYRPQTQKSRAFILCPPCPNVSENVRCVSAAVRRKAALHCLSSCRAVGTLCPWTHLPILVPPRFSVYLRVLRFLRGAPSYARYHSSSGSSFARLSGRVVCGPGSACQPVDPGPRRGCTCVH